MSADKTRTVVCREAAIEADIRRCRRPDVAAAFGRDVDADTRDGAVDGELGRCFRARGGA